MTDPVVVNYWASFVFSYRRLHSLTQDQLAEKLKVSQQTVSRWEAGQQVPDPHSQAVLRQVLGESDLTSQKNWIERIQRASGFEALIDRELRVLSASMKMQERFDTPLERSAGRHIKEFFPSNRPQSLEKAVEAGIFDGTLAGVHWTSEVNFGHRTYHADTDIWPVLTSDAGILLQIVVAPKPGRQNPGAEGVITVEVVMNRNDFVGQEV